jgi:phospholipid transport system substrate-binding protein
MKRSCQWIARMALAAFLMAVAPLAGAAGDPPDALVKRSMEDVLQAIKQNPDRAALRKVAEEKVLPYFDFTDMTRLAVGVAWRRATPEQQKALEDSFRTLLVNTYANALAQAGGGNRSIDVKPAAPSGSDTVVRTQVKENGKQPIAIDYRLHDKNGAWKIFDVTVEGVSLVTNYRTTFSEEVNKSGIDGLIKSLQDRNRTLAKT